MTAAERARQIKEQAAADENARAWLAPLTEFLRIVLFEQGEERAFSTHLTAEARENAVCAALSRIRRICDTDI